MDDSLLLPREERVLGGLDYDNTLQTSASIPLFTYDPLAIPELLSIRTDCFALADDRATAQDFAIEIHPDLDSFERLPVEVVQIILNFLPSRDVLNLKIASSVVASTSLPKLIWPRGFFLAMNMSIFSKLVTVPGTYSAERHSTLVSGTS